MVLEKKVNTTPIDYAVLNQLSQDFEKRFIPQTELSVKQSFWSQNSMNSSDPSPSCRPTKVEVPKELPKVSMVNTRLKKLKHHLAEFDVVVKERTTATVITKGSWGFEHTKAYFRDEIIPFVKALKDIFNTFDQYLIDELTEVQNVFHQMEQAVEQHIISKDIVNIIVNSSMDNAYVNMHECEKCLKLETKLLNKKDFIEKETYDKLFRSYTTLKKHCISLEVDTQLNQEIFQRDNSVSNQSAPNFDQYFELNELKGQSQEKDMVIKKLKERIKSLSGNMNEDKVKKDMEEIETINIELDHRVSKLIAENEHLKQTYKQLYDSIKPTRIRSKEQCDALVNQVNQKSVEISDLNASLQEKVLLQKCLRLMHTQEQAEILREVVEQEKSQNPLNNPLDSACNTKKDKIQKTPSSTQNNKVDAHSRTVKSSVKNNNCVVEPNRTANVQHSTLNANSKLLCVKCNGCMLSDNHDLCVLDFINDVNAHAKSKSVKKISKRKVWKPTGKVFTNIRYIWRPTGQTFTIVENACPLTRITKTTEVVQIVLWYLDSSCSKQMTGDRSQLTNFFNKFLGTFKFRNDYMAKILGYGDYQIGNVTISRVYYVEGLGHNLFFVGQFCDSNLEVTFRQHTCFICNLVGVYLLTGSRSNNLYTLSLGDMMASSPICLLSKASKTNKRKPYKPKSEDISQEKLYLSHMDLCGPMCVTSVNGKKYILIIIDDYTRFTWVKCLRSKDEAPDFIINQWNYYEKADILMNHFVAILYSTNGVIQRTEAVATTCYTQNRSIIRRLHGKTPYEILHYKLPDLSFFYVFGALCYPTNDSENLGKLQPKADIDFDELTAMASEHSSSGPALHEMTPATITMEEELNEFERLEVWELVPRPDKVMVITLKWIYKVKLDEVRGILKNKARLVTRGYRQEEGINFEESFALVARS
ncbi:retrovirus-related pol polyprotein from transposon TNT 1-94 [Tanacetum coccineum]|uniref:Retrovirus-related pol polyprotein from transposon TNT 1-94 n=1 Tax=Tanacetum coccineum TaxID=301880 RepID=A0ABQ4ZES5_9ASTR